MMSRIQVRAQVWWLSGKNAAIPSPYVDIDSQSDLDIPISHRKEK